MPDPTSPAASGGNTPEPDRVSPRDCTRLAWATTDELVDELKRRTHHGIVMVCLRARPESFTHYFWGNGFWLLGSLAQLRRDIRRWVLSCTPPPSHPPGYPTDLSEGGGS